MVDPHKRESNERAEGVATGAGGTGSGGVVVRRLRSLVNGGNIYGRFFMSCLILLLLALNLGIYGIIRTTDSANEGVLAFALPLCTGLFILHLVLCLFAVIVYADDGLFDKIVFACYAAFLSGGPSAVRHYPTHHAVAGSRDEDADSPPQVAQSAR